MLVVPNQGASSVSAPPSLAPASPPVPEPVAKHFEYRPEGRLPTNNGQPCSHYERTDPPLFTARMLNKCEEEPVAHYTNPRLQLQQWLALRPGLLESFAGITEKTCVWPKGTGSREAELPDMLREGQWLWLPLASWGPPSDKRPPMMEFEQLRGFRTAIHATNLYCLNNVVQSGLRPGPTPGKGNMVGLYAFENKGESRFTRSAGYAVYSKIAEADLYFAPFHLVAWKEEDMWQGDHSAKIAAGANQLCLPEWLYNHVGTFVHVLSAHKRDTGTRRWMNYDQFDPAYEIPLGSRPLEPAIEWPWESSGASPEHP